MRIRNKEHQSLGKKELQQLCQDFPNDQQLGEEVRKIASATTNNPKGLRATSLDYELKIEELESIVFSRNRKGSCSLNVFGLE